MLQHKNVSQIFLKLSSVILIIKGLWQNVDCYGQNCIAIASRCDGIKGLCKSAYIAVLQRLLRRCRNPRSAAIHEVECSSARGLRLEHCGTFKFEGARATMHEMECSSRALRQPQIVHCGGLCIAAAAMYDLRLPQLARVGRF